MTVKYGHHLIKTLVCDKCNDSQCEVRLKRTVLKGRESTDDFVTPKWIEENKCMFQSFNDAEWHEDDTVQKMVKGLMKVSHEMAMDDEGVSEDGSK